MPQPLFIQCLRIDPNNEEEKDEFLETYQKHVHQRYNTPKTQYDIQIETAKFDAIRVNSVQQDIQNTVNAWYTILTLPENQQIPPDASQTLRAIKTVLLPKTQPRYTWIPEHGLKKLPEYTIIKLYEFLFQDLLETMHTKFNALARCTAQDCDNFFIQQGRKDPQIFCSDRCRSRIRKRQSRERKNLKNPRKK